MVVSQSLWHYSIHIRLSKHDNHFEGMPKILVSETPLLIPSIFTDILSHYIYFCSPHIIHTKVNHTKVKLSRDLFSWMRFMIQWQKKLWEWRSTNPLFSIPLLDLCCDITFLQYSLLFPDPPLIFPSVFYLVIYCMYCIQSLWQAFNCRKHQQETNGSFEDFFYC